MKVKVLKNINNLVYLYPVAANKHEENKQWSNQNEKRTRALARESQNSGLRITVDLVALCWGDGKQRLGGNASKKRHEMDTDGLLSESP